MSRARRPDGCNAAYIISDQGDISFDGGDADASVAVEPGTLAAVRTSDGLLVAWDPDASGTGVQTCVGICARLAEVKGHKLFFGNDTLTEAKAALKLLNIVVR